MYSKHWFASEIQNVYIIRIQEFELSEKIYLTRRAHKHSLNVVTDFIIFYIKSNMIMLCGGHFAHAFLYDLINITNEKVVKL